MRNIPSVLVNLFMKWILLILFTQSQYAPSVYCDTNSLTRYWSGSCWLIPRKYILLPIVENVRAECDYNVVYGIMLLLMPHCLLQHNNSSSINYYNRIRHFERQYASQFRGMTATLGEVLSILNVQFMHIICMLLFRNQIETVDKYLNLNVYVR